MTRRPVNRCLLVLVDLQRCASQAVRKGQASSVRKGQASSVLLFFLCIWLAVINLSLFCSYRRLFATLDPTLRRVLLPSGREAILSDTVGFISDLPHQLVDAFRVSLGVTRPAW